MEKSSVHSGIANLELRQGKKSNEVRTNYSRGFAINTSLFPMLPIGGAVSRTDEILQADDVVGTGGLQHQYVCFWCPLNASADAISESSGVKGENLDI